jgi:hypothetical protein
MSVSAIETAPTSSQSQRLKNSRTCVGLNPAQAGIGDLVAGGRRTPEFIRQTSEHID